MLLDGSFERDHVEQGQSGIVIHLPNQRDIRPIPIRIEEINAYFGTTLIHFLNTLIPVFFIDRLNRIDIGRELENTYGELPIFVLLDEEQMPAFISVSGVINSQPTAFSNNMQMEMKFEVTIYPIMTTEDKPNTRGSTIQDLLKQVNQVFQLTSNKLTVFRRIVTETTEVCISDPPIRHGGREPKSISGIQKRVLLDIILRSIILDIHTHFYLFIARLPLRHS